MVYILRCLKPSEEYRQVIRKLRIKVIILILKETWKRHLNKFGGGG